MARLDPGLIVPTVATTQLCSTGLGPVWAGRRPFSIFQTRPKARDMSVQPSQTLLCEDIPDGYLAVGDDGGWFAVNGHAEELLGIRRETFLGQPCSGAAPALLQQPDLQRALASGVAADLELCDPPGRWIEVRVRPLPSGGSSLYLRDVTERKQVQDALRASEERFTRFMENLPGLAWMKDLEGRYVYANAAASDAFRYPLEQLLGKMDEELFPPDTARVFRENDRHALAKPGGVQVVEALEQEAGVLHYSIVSKFPVVDAAGSVRAVGGMAIDITDRIRAEEALRAADQRKDEFLAMLAHELRNPLAPLVTAAELLRLRSPDHPILQRQGEVIGRQVRLMKRLLDDLLDVSRITRGKVKLSPARLDLNAVLRDAVEMSRPLIEERGHSLELIPSPEPLLADADHARLSQVFTNLLNNAARYTPPGGKIRLSASRDGDRARIEVHDNGIGMTPQVLEHAFELFSQGERPLSRAEGGLGIGLTLVRQLVELHGGTVDAESPGLSQGSTFRVLLPLSGPEAPPE